MNLIAELKELLKGEVNQKAALLVGEKEDKVKLAFDALVSTSGCNIVTGKRQA